jgi:hypothetical protein
MEIESRIVTSECTEKGERFINRFKVTVTLEE